MLNWSEEKLSREMKFIKKAKEDIQQSVYGVTGIMIDKPDSLRGGNTNTGNVIKSILNTDNRKLLLSHIDSTSLCDTLETIMMNIAVIIAVMSSSGKVNVEAYQELCRTTAVLVKTDILDHLGESWVMFTPTVHALLAHSSELITANGNRGLANFSEQGLEANNKFLRIIRLYFSRKTNQFDNLTDCMKKLWVKSDPKIVKTNERLLCRHCTQSGHTTRSCPDLAKLFYGPHTSFQTLYNFLTA